MKKLLSLIVGALATTVAPFAAVHAAPLKIRIAWIVPVANIAPILFAEPGIAKNSGKTYTIEPVHFQGTPQMITALAVGDLDIGLLGFSSLNLAVQNAGMTDLRVFASEIDDGVDGYATNQFRVRADSPIVKVADLKGKVLATNITGSAVDIAMQMMLDKAGLKEKRDYTVVESAFGTMKSMLAEKKVDLISAVPPFSEDAQLQKDSRVLFTERDGMQGPSSLGIWVAKESFLKKNHAAMLDFLKDAIRATRWYLDPKNHAAAVKIASKFAKAPPSLFNSWLFTKRDYYRSPDMLPNLKELQANIDLQQKFGIFKQRIDVNKYADLSLVQEAAKDLK